MLATVLSRGHRSGRYATPTGFKDGAAMNNLIYLIGLVVVVMLVLSFFGLR
jgi:hypothetical protein